VTKLQAAVRAKKHRKLVEAKKKAGPTGAEFKEALEPYITTAVATAIAVQWDDALTRIIATDENRESFALVNAVGTTMYAAVLYLVLMYVSEYFNRRLLNMIKQALQILVGWMWKGVVAAVDEDMRNLHLRELSGRDRLWAGFGITTAFAIVWAPLFTFVCTAILHTTRTSPKDSFVKHFGGLMLGASALVIGYAWHLALLHFSTAVVYNELDVLPSVRLFAAIVRSAILTIIVGLIKAYSIFAEAAKVDKPPKPTDTFYQNFRDRSRFVGNKSLIFIVAFSWYNIIQSMDIAFEDSSDGWGPYIVYTVFTFFFLGFACVLAYRGSATAMCCTPMKMFAYAELLYFSTVAVQMGWAVKDSYNELIFQTVEQDENTNNRLNIISWSIGGTLMLILWLSIFLVAVFGNVRRSSERENEVRQL